MDGGTSLGGVTPFYFGKNSFIFQMPKSRERQTNRGSWTPEALQRAINSVNQDNKGVRQSAREFGKK